MKQLFLDQMLTINNTLRKLKILSLNNFIVLIKIKLSILEESQVKLPNQKQIIKRYKYIHLKEHKKYIIKLFQCQVDKLGYNQHCISKILREMDK